jgi:hypothetical protein
MLESFLAKYGYITILLGTVFEGGEMPEDNSTTVSEESATKKSLLKRMFGLYEIIPIVLMPACNLRYAQLELRKFLEQA